MGAGLTRSRGAWALGVLLLLLCRPAPAWADIGLGLAYYRNESIRKAKEAEKANEEKER